MPLPLQIIPIPMSLGLLFLMGLGAFFWLMMTLLALRDVYLVVRKKGETVWNSKTGDFEPKTLSNSAPGWIALFIAGLFFFAIGYLGYIFF